MRDSIGLVMHSIVKSVFLLIAALLLCLNVRQAYADTPYDTMGMVFANADAGWETLIIANSFIC